MVLVEKIFSTSSTEKLEKEASFSENQEVDTVVVKNKEYECRNLEKMHLESYFHTKIMFN